MKRIVAFLLIILMSPFAMAGDGYYTADAQKIVDSSTGFADSLRGEYAELEKQILAIEPGFSDVVSKIKFLDENQKLTIARSYLAQKTFDYYKDAFMAELEQRSAETGRKIVTESFASDKGHNFTEKFWRLDRGELDSNKCKKDGWEICKYPDGFENVSIELQESTKKDEYGIQTLFGNNNVLKSLVYRKDMPDKNTTQICDVMVSYQSNKTYTENNLSEESLSLDVYCNVLEYNRYYAWLNQEVEDTINGKHDVIGTEVLSDGRTYIIERQSEDFSKWKSNFNIPGGYVLGRDYDYSRSVSTSTK